MFIEIATEPDGSNRVAIRVADIKSFSESELDGFTDIIIRDGECYCIPEPFDDFMARLRSYLGE